MYLNNKGWSMGTMISLVCGLLFFLLVAMLIAYNFGIEKGSPNSIYEEIPDDKDIAQ